MGYPDTPHMHVYRGWELFYKRTFREIYRGNIPCRIISKLKLAYFFCGNFWWKFATCAVRKCNKSAKTRECRNYAIKKELGRENTRWKGECQMHVYWHNGPCNRSGAQPLPVFRKFLNIFFFSWICGEEYKMSRILLSRRVLYFVLSKSFLWKI